MPNFIDLTGKQFGRWSVKRLYRRTQSVPRRSDTRWLCECACGTRKTVRSSGLMNGSSSCGCLKAEQASIRSTTHGQTKGGQSSTYQTWARMWQRCTNTKLKQYTDYGGRGIKVCARWKRFENFCTDMGERPKGLSLDRIDNNGNYTPKNCRWATRIEQAANKRQRKDRTLITFEGKTLTIQEWAKIIGLPCKTLRMRLYTGWRVALALTLPNAGHRGKTLWKTRLIEEDKL